MQKFSRRNSSLSVLSSQKQSVNHPLEEITEPKPLPPSPPADLPPSPSVDKVNKRNSSLSVFGPERKILTNSLEVISETKPLPPAELPPPPSIDLPPVPPTSITDMFKQAVKDAKEAASLEDQGEIEKGNLPFHI
jgi:hypothetical protein